MKRSPVKKLSSWNEYVKQHLSKLMKKKHSSFGEAIKELSIKYKIDKLKNFNKKPTMSSSYIQATEALVLSHKLYDAFRSNEPFGILWDHLEYDDEPGFQKESTFDTLDRIREKALNDLDTIVGELNFECDDNGDDLPKSFKKSVLQKFKELTIDYHLITKHLDLFSQSKPIINDETEDDYVELFGEIQTSFQQLLNLPFGYKNVVFKKANTEQKQELKEDYPTIQTIWTEFSELSNGHINHIEKEGDTAVLVYYYKS